MRGKKQVAKSSKKLKRKSSKSSKRVPAPSVSGMSTTSPRRKRHDFKKKSLPEPERKREETSGPWNHIDVDSNSMEVSEADLVPEPEKNKEETSGPWNHIVVDHDSMEGSVAILAPEPELEVIPPQSVEVIYSPYIFPSSSDILMADFILPDAQIIEAEIDFVDFPPGPERDEQETNGPWNHIDVGSDSMDASVVVLVPEPEHEIIPPQSVEVTCASSVDRYSLEWLETEPKMFDDNEVLELWTDVNPGSDVEEPLEEDNIGIIELMPSEEQLPSDLVLRLEEMDTRDDSALIEAASSNEDMMHFDWSNDPDKFVGKQEVFTGKSGPTFNIEGMTPLEVFQKIWDDEILEIIVRETNRYGRQLYVEKNKPWTDFNANDIWTFLALVMLQSILILPVEREYWYPSMTQLKVRNFQNIMSFEKFIKIKKCLHFVDNHSLKPAVGETRNSQKIQPIIEHLNHKFSSLYLPEQYIAIDESLLLWKGRLSFVQLIANKAAKVGIKSYELCESRTGYLWKMILYTGKGEKSQPASDTTTAVPDEPEGVTSKIVYDLVRPLLNKGHTLVMDNFYNSPLLSRSLKTKKTDTMGTLRLTRAFVPESLRSLTKANTRPGEVVFSQTKDLTITVWHDSKIVAMISTYHSSEVGGKEKFGTYKYKPKVVLDYNMTMGGIDKKDQMLQAFPVERVRNLVWYKKLFRRLLNVSIYNAFVIYNHNKNGNQRKFRVALAKEILEKVQRQIPDPRQEIIRTDHFPAKSESNRTRCKMCSLKKVQTRTAFKCDTCNVNLCIVGCFKEYHLME